MTDQLVQKAIPACRRAGIPIVWLGSGPLNDDLDTLPPTIIRGFSLDTNFDKPEAQLKGLGQDMGRITLQDGTKVEAGRALMREQWNTQVYTELMEVSQPDHQS